MGEDQHGPRRRLSVNEAADELGVSVDAIRSRVKRGTIPHIRRGGRVWVLLGTDQGNRPPQEESASSALMSEMRARVQFLEDELQRKDAILLNMTEAMKALSSPGKEVPPDARESSGTAREGQPGAGVSPEAQEGVRRPWWRRMFGG